MNPIDWLVDQVAPAAGLRRAQARAARKALMHYDAATTGARASSRRPVSSDADGAAGKRDRLAYVARDMIRNTPFASRAQTVIANSVVGDGIICKVRTGDARVAEEFRARLKLHFDTVAIDADGRSNLYGIQRLVMNAMVDAGEVLIRRRRRSASDGLPLPFQLQVLEQDYLDTSRDGVTVDGNALREGIEYDKIGRRVAYWLFEDHPGSRTRFGPTWQSRRIPASEILHIYRQDRPGQMRGVSWFAPVAMAVQDLGDYQDAQLVRQKVAACFAGFRVSPDSEPVGSDVPALSGAILPGRIQNLAPGEDIRFSAPPATDGYDEFTKSVLRSVAAGMGITYEALTGDLKGVNFTSGRMGRMDMDRNVSAWQWLLLIPQMMQPLAVWTLEAFALQAARRLPDDLGLEWVPPHRMLVDPTREIPALSNKVRAGFASRQGVVRELGFDPEEILAEQVEDMRASDRFGLVFDSDARMTSGAGQMQPMTETEGPKDAE